MNYDKLKKVCKMTFQEISVESGVGTSTCHNYFNDISTVNAKHCIAIENAVVAVAKKRLNSIEEALNE